MEIIPKRIPAAPIIPTLLYDDDKFLVFQTILWAELKATKAFHIQRHTPHGQSQQWKLNLFECVWVGYTHRHTEMRVPIIVMSFSLL